jgi:hypothetical protein
MLTRKMAEELDEPNYFPCYFFFKGVGMIIKIEQQQRCALCYTNSSAGTVSF